MTNLLSSDVFFIFLKWQRIYQKMIKFFAVNILHYQ